MVKGRAAKPGFMRVRSPQQTLKSRLRAPPTRVSSSTGLTFESPGDAVLEGDLGLVEREQLGVVRAAVVHPDRLVGVVSEAVARPPARHLEHRLRQVVEAGGDPPAEV